MEFIIGKYYKTRGGKKTKCRSFDGMLYVMEFENWSTYKVDPLGRRFSEGEQSDLDIVAEWSEQPLKLEVGKWYKAENGEVGECVGVDGMREVFSVKFQQSKICYFNEDGSRWYKVKEHKPELRIVSEVPNPNPGEVCEREVVDLSQLGVGAIYLTEAKEQVLIYFHDASFEYPFLGSNGYGYFSDGFMNKEKLPNPLNIVEYLRMGTPQEIEATEVNKNTIEPQESEALPFDFNLMSTEQFQQHLTETIKNKKAQRERNLFGAIARAHQSHEVVPSWMLEEILSLRSEAETELFQKQFEPTKESELEKDGRNFEELEVGGVYSDREGDMVKIVSITEQNKEQPYKSDGGDSYSPNGNFSLTTFKSPYDLIRKIN